MARKKYDIDYIKESNKPTGVKQKRDFTLLSAGILFLVVGLILIILGSVFLHNEMDRSKEERIYTTATIVEIESEFYHGSSTDVRYIVHVAHIYNNEIVYGTLDTVESGMYVGQELEVYFYEDDVHFLHKEGGEYVGEILMFVLGTVCIAVGIFLICISRNNQQKNGNNFGFYQTV